MSGRPKYFGKYRAYVVDVDDPLKMGRIRVDCPKVTGGLTEWCMPCISANYDNGGDFHFPKIGETVFIEFEDGDFKYPIYTGGWFNEGTNPLPEYDPDLRIISWGDNIIYMEKDKLTVTNSKSKVVFDDVNVEINSAEKVTISGSKNITVTTPSQISISGNDTVSLNSEEGIILSAPQCEMTFKNGDMHFNSSQGDIDVTESGIEINNKSGSKINANRDKVTISARNIIISADEKIILKSEHNEVTYD